LKRKIEEYWSRYPPGIDSPSKDIPFGSKPFYEAIDKKRHNLEPYIPQLISSLDPLGKKLLEVGCGLGADMRQFARLGADVVAIELSKSNAYISKHGLKVCGLDGEVLVADAEHLPFRDFVFNLVYSFGVLHHTPDTQKAVSEIYRVLKHDGRILVMLYHKGLAYYWIILRYGLLQLELFRVPMERLISKRYDHTPLSKMYSRKQAKALFAKFSRVRLRCINFGGIRANPRLKLLWALFKKFPTLERIFGSFLIIEAEKGSV
jgi:ubiquinone/menaquinone biosynthesis C-methylase UbiE